MRTWYALAVKAEAVELSIFDEIGGWGIPVAEFKREFDAVKNAAEIRLTLNSPGGNVFDGMALYNVLSSVRPKLVVEVVGAAASIASLVALAGRELVMGEGSYFMIHNPWAAVMGDADELLKVADMLEKIRGEMANIYAARSSLARDEVLAAMAEETWYTAAEAVTAGFASSVRDYGEIAALAYDFSRYTYARVPDRLRSISGPASQATEAAPAHGDGESHPKEGSMVTLSNVLEFLGQAKPEDKAVIVKELGLSEAQAATKERDELKGQVATLTDVNAALKAKVDAQAAAELAARKTQAIEAALREGRILPKDRAKWEARFDEQPDFTAKVLDDLPKAIDYETHGHGGGGGEGDGLSPEDVQAMEALHMTEADYRKYQAAHEKAEESSQE